LFLLPSEKESFGLAALEAMACQVPVISSNTGGIPEININGVTGFLSQVGDVQDMAEKALFVLDDQNHKQFKKNALERVQLFDLKNVLPLYENFYKEIIEKCRAAVI